MANSYLTRSLVSTGNNKIGTLSFWMKRSELSTNQVIWNPYTSANTLVQMKLATDDALKMYWYDGGTTIASLLTNRVFRDTSAYYHIVLVINSDESSSSDRLKLYVNGVQETSFSSSGYPASGIDMQINNSGSTDVIGRYQDGTTNYFNGVLSNIAWVDGAALAPTVFGQEDSTSGIWKFKKPTGVTWGTNGFWLEGENSGSLGTDSSGNGNTFTPGGDLKQSLDTPSNLFACINTLNLYSSGSPGKPDLEYGNLQIAGSTSGAVKWYGASTLGVSQGKWYWEIKNYTTSNASLAVGVVTDPNSNQYENQAPGARQSGISTENYSGNIVINNSNVSVGYGSTWTGNGDICMIALDLTNDKFFLGKDGVWADSDDPSNNTGGYSLSTVTNISGFYHAAFGSTSGTYMNSMSVNFGTGYFGTTAVSSAGTSSSGDDSVWEYNCPTGFYGLNTKNINTYG